MPEHSRNTYQAHEAKRNRHCGMRIRRHARKLVQDGEQQDAHVVNSDEQNHDKTMTLSSFIQTPPISPRNE